MATIFHIGGTRNGTGFGQVTSGTTENKMNNINYNSYFHDDIKLPGKCDQQTTSWETFTSGSTNLQFSKIGSHVYMSGTIVGNSSMNITIPQRYWPSKGVRFLTRSTDVNTTNYDGRIMHYLLNVDGTLTRQWAYYAINTDQGTDNLSDTGNRTSYTFEIDYWGNPD